MRHVPKPAVPPSKDAAVRVAPRLTGVERDILDFMVLYLRTHTYQPSIREIGEKFGIKSTKTVSEHLQSLADKGFLERDPSRSRGVRIVGLDLNPQTVAVPCYRDLAEAAGGGRSGARRPAPLILSLDRHLVGGKGCFMVRCPGNQLAVAGIEDGDFMVIEPVLAEELSAGEIVAARVAGVHDYYRLRRNGSEMSLHVIGRQPAAGGAPASTRAKSSSLLLVGRVSAIYRRVGSASFTGSDATH